MIYDDEKDVVISGSESGEIICWKCLIDEKSEFVFRQIYNVKVHSKRINSIWYHTNLDLLISTSEDGYTSLYEKYIKLCYELTPSEVKIALELHFRITENSIKINYFDNLINEIKKDNLTHDWKFKKVEKALVNYELFKSQIFDENIIEAIEKRRIQFSSTLKEQTEKNFESLEEKRKNILNKYSKAFVDSPEETIKEIDNEYEREMEILLKKQKQEVLDLQMKYEDLKVNFSKVKKKERYQGAEDYLKVETKFKTKMDKLDNSISVSFLRMIHSVETIKNLTFHNERYKIISKLDENVYKAIDFKLMEFVAIKRYPDTVSILYFKHPNLIQVQNSIAIGTETFVVRELMKGNLLTEINKKGRIEDIEIKSYMKQILTGLEYLHSNKAVHRNLSLENIFLTNENRIKIYHVGLMKTLRSNVEISLNGIVYSPPEFYSYLVSFSTDVWCLGLIFIFLLQNPEERIQHQIFHGTTLDEVLSSISEYVPLHSKDLKDFLKLIDREELREKFTKLVDKKVEKFSKIISNASHSSLDLIDKMLKFVPKQRISVQDILKHPYFHE
jgi:WD40 repeat protein